MAEDVTQQVAPGVSTPDGATVEPLPPALPSISEEEGQKMRGLRDQHRRKYNGPTRLSPSEERQFRQDLSTSGWYRGFRDRFGEAPDHNDPSYDLRGAWKALGKDKLPGEGQHWPDSQGDQWLKSPEHPTAWMEYYQRVTGRDPGQDGIKTEDALRSMGDQLPRLDMENPDPNAPEVMPLSQYLREMVGGGAKPSK